MKLHRLTLAKGLQHIVRPGRLFTREFFRSAFALAFLVLVSTLAHAQGYGTITGTVTDGTGASIPSASVTVVDLKTNRKIETTSGKDGLYTFPTLAPTDYTVSVSASGFQTTTQTGITLQANQSLTIGLVLQVGSESQTVTVSSQAPQVDVSTGTLAQVINQRQVVDLPLNGRNAASLITLSAGVSDGSSANNGTDEGVGKTFPVVVLASVNGLKNGQNNYLLDGGNNTDEMTNVNAPYPFPDALQEFSVQTSNFAPEFGHSAGAVINIVTKSGGDKFHGDLFEFLRNGYFNAKPYFANTADNLHRHQFGGTIGGPVLIPHLSTGKTTQFFFGYQHTLVHSLSNANTVTVPTLAEEGRTSTGAAAAYADYGNLCTGGYNSSNICQTANQIIRNPFTNAPYALNQIPSSNISPAAFALQKDFPTYAGTEAPGKIGGLVSYTLPTVQAFNEYVGRVDHQFGANDHLFVRYYYDWFQQDPNLSINNLQAYRSYFNTRYQNSLISESHTFTPNLLNNFTASYQREVALRGGPPGSPYITDFGVKNLWQPDTGPYLQAIVSGYFQVSSSAFASWLRNNYTFHDDVDWVKRGHNVAFGAELELSKFDVDNVNSSYGTFNFAPTTNAVSGTTYQYPNGAANFLQGFMSSFVQGTLEQVGDRAKFPGIYVQDSWKATKRLTLNYGVRWEMFEPWKNNIGFQPVFKPAAYAANTGSSRFTNLPAGELVYRDPGVQRYGVGNLYKQFMPRLGFAYDVMGDGKTSIRGGFGIFYQDRTEGFFNLNQSAQAPNTLSVSLTAPAMYNPVPGTNPGGPFDNPYCTGCAVGAYANPFPFAQPLASSTVFPKPVTVYEYDPSGNYQVPVTYDYNAVVEHQFTGSLFAHLAYVGTGSRHLFVSLENNPAVNTGSSLSTNQRRVYNTAPTVGPCTTSVGCQASYGPIDDAAMIGNAHYNSLQATLEKRMSHGLSFIVNYTFSKAYDDLAVTNANNDINSSQSYVYPLYPANATGIPSASYVTDIKALDRGLSDIDHTHVVSASSIWELPKLHTGYRAVQAITNGWRVSALLSHRSGDTLTATAGQDLSLTGLNQDRALRNFSLPAYSKDANNAGNCGSQAHCRNFINPAAFSMPVNTDATRGFGNVVKDSIRGPGYTNIDASVVRTFPIYRETALDFRVEYFNVFNHTELGDPALSSPLSSSTSFGTITALAANAGPRIAQFALKYIF
ncbi:Carboxypeptidase regulatory-like domain-containing protein [Granulicella rosea]|uniref:Carboxypeptidase regulatory-like domain-containing protein n=1 Tax=Granulicella rosea TaxID=474952 RepID=A0A239J4D6_9BACT|nr:carboxypeptidase-like regulatory domain-containing protein [Granulicella rosea]SNS99514.1 Carboxypeptidase regulatory-like domain-containing protein [Granulicella rosea]